MQVYEFTQDKSGYLHPKCPHKPTVSAGKSKPSIGSFACVSMCAYCRGYSRGDEPRDIGNEDECLDNMWVKCCADEEV